MVRIAKSKGHVHWMVKWIDERGMVGLNAQRERTLLLVLNVLSMADWYQRRHLAAVAS